MPNRRELSYSVNPEDLPDLELGEVPSDRVFRAALSSDAGRAIAGAQFTAQAGAEVRIGVYNAPEDHDPAGILASAESAAMSAESEKIRPQLILDPENAWVRYAFDAHVRGRGGVSLERAGIHIEGDHRVTLLDYRRHRRDKLLVKAVLEDVKRPRVVTRYDDIRSLPEGEALAYQVRGGIQTRVEVNGADLMTAGVKELAAWVHSDEPIALRVDVGWSVWAQVSWVDDFVLVFTRGKDGIRVALQKNASRSVNASARLAVSVELEDSETWVQAVESWKEQLVGAEIQKVDELLASTSLDEIRADTVQSELLDQIARRLGVVASTLENLDRLRARWAELKTRLNGWLTDWLRGRVETGFEHDYQRIQETDTLLAATLPEDVLEGLHEDLLRADLGSTLNWLRDHPKALERYLEKDRLAVSRAWGLALNVGSRWSWATGGEKKLEEITRRDLKGRSQVVFVGERAYEEKRPGGGRRWRADFRAAMPERSMYEPPHGPRAHEMSLGLALSFQVTEKKGTRDELDALLDLGRLWGFLDADDLPEIGNSLNAGLKVPGSSKRKGFVAQLDLRLDHKAFLRFAQRVREMKASWIPEALAGALPHLAKLEARSSETRRRRLYAPVWVYYLGLGAPQRAALSRQELGRQAHLILRNLDGGKKAALFETEASGPKQNLSFVGQAFNHPMVQEDVSGFLKALERVSEIYAPGAEGRHISTRVFRKVFDGLQGFQHQELYVRALGFLIASSMWADRLEGSFWVEIEGESERRVFLGSNQTL